MSDKAGGSKHRMVNLEVLRCLAMMMVVVLHYLGKGGLLSDLTEANIDGTGIAAWILEAFCIVAVNVYMMISGYFLCNSSFKLSRLLQLLLQVWTYSVVVGVLGVITGILPAAEVDTHYFLTLLFPISMEHYWFMTAYVFLYLLLPFIGAGVRKMTKPQMQLVLVLLLGAFCVMKTVLPVRLETDAKGYDCLWYVCVFVVAAYIRRFGISFLENKVRAWALYVVACLGIVAEAFLFRFVYLKTGSLGLILKISYEYNHLLPLLAAVALFCAFLKVKALGRLAQLLAKVAPYTLGVYLLHENMGVRYGWQNWFGAGRIHSVGGLILGILIAVVCVFVCGILVEMIRSKVMHGLHVLLSKLTIYRKLIGKIEAADELFKVKS